MSEIINSFDDITRELEYIHAPKKSKTRTPIGDGTDSNPFQLWFLEHLDWMREDNGPGRKIYKMMRDMDFSDDRFYIHPQNRKLWTGNKGWHPILNHQLFGNFLGNEKKLFNLYINRPDEDNVGLFFNMIDLNAKDFSLINADVTGNDYVGALTGRMLKQCILSNLYMSGRVQGVDKTGGIAGAKEGDSKVENLYVSNEVLGRNYVGGVFGKVGRYMTGTKMKDITHKGKVFGEKYVGGIIGMNIAKMNILRVTSDSEILGINKVGGIVGESVDSIEITRAKARSRITGNNSVGGILGKAKYDSILAHIEVFAEIKGNSCVGGLIGKAFNHTKILIGETKGSTSGVTNVGGVIGKLQGIPEINIVTAFSDIYGEKNVGGIFGSLNYLGVDNVIHTGQVKGMDNTGNVAGECHIYETKGIGITEKLYPMENIRGFNGKNNV